MFGTFDGGRTEAFRPRIPPGRGKGWQEIRRDEGNDVGLSLFVCMSVSRERNYIEIWWTQKYIFFSVKQLFSEQSICKVSAFYVK